MTDSALTLRKNIALRGFLATATGACSDWKNDFLAVIDAGNLRFVQQKTSFPRRKTVVSCGETDGLQRQTGFSHETILCKKHEEAADYAV